MCRKSYSILFAIILFFMFYIECSSDYYVKEVSKYTGSPLVERVMPANGEQNIISKPEIKIYYSNLYNIDLKSIKLSVNYKDITNKTIITSKYISYTPEKKFKRGVQVARLELCDSSQKNNETVLEWFFTVGSPTFNHYNGIFFDKSNNTNIEASYKDIYDVSRYANKLHFISITEKINTKDNTNSILKQSHKNWNKLLESRDAHTTIEQFVALSSFEFTSKLQNNKTGKLNIYNCDEPFIYNKNIDIDSMYKNLYYNDNDIIGQFKSDDDFDDLDYLKYSLYGDDFMTLFELNKNIDNKKTSLSFDNYIEALENGWHVAPIISQYDEKSVLNLKEDFRTFVLCENLSKNDILDAFKNRRVYASEDKNITVDFTINRMPMGSIIESTNSLRFIVSAVDNDTEHKITKIQLYEKNKKLIKEKNFDSNYAKMEFSLNKNLKSNYYFAIITQENNKKTITAPIWIENN